LDDHGTTVAPGQSIVNPDGIPARLDVEDRPDDCPDDDPPDRAIYPLRPAR
jgi:hypothetical protein